MNMLFNKFSGFKIAFLVLLITGYATATSTTNTHRPTSIFQQSIMETQHDCVAGDCDKDFDHRSVKHAMQKYGGWTVWGQVFYSRMRDNRDDDGGNQEKDTVRTIVESVSIEKQLNRKWSAGTILMNQYAKLETGHTFNSQASDIFSKVTIKGKGIFPFVRYMTNIGMQIYALVGYARSSVKFRDFVRPIIDHPPYKTHESTVVAQIRATQMFRITAKDFLTGSMGYVFRKSRLGDYVAPGPLYVPKQYTRNGIINASATYARVFCDRIRAYLGGTASYDIYRSRTTLDIWPREDYRKRLGIGARAGIIANISKRVSAVVEYSHKRWTSKLKIDGYFAGVRVKF